MRISDWSSDVCSSDLIGQAQLEQPVAAARLAVVVALGHRPREDFDLAIVETEAAIDGGDLRLDRALVRQQDAGLAALDDGRRDRRAVDVGERLRGEDDAGVLLAQRLEPLAKLACKARSEEHTSELQSLMRISYAVFSL